VGDGCTRKLLKVFLQQGRIQGEQVYSIESTCQQSGRFMYFLFSLHGSYNLGVRLAYLCFSISLMLVAISGLRQEFVTHRLLLQGPMSGDAEGVFIAEWQMPALSGVDRFTIENTGLKLVI
jgi:hypothetical protein